MHAILVFYVSLVVHGWCAPTGGELSVVESAPQMVVAYSTFLGATRGLQLNQLNLSIDSSVFIHTVNKAKFDSGGDFNAPIWHSFYVTPLVAGQSTEVL